MKLGLITDIHERVESLRRALDRLRGENRELAETVVERTRELAETTHRFEAALDGSDVTMSM